MNEKPYADILSALRSSSANSDLRHYNVMLLSNVVLHPLENILKCHLLEHSITIDYLPVDYDSALQTCLGLDNVDARPDCVILLFYLPQMSALLTSDYYRATQEQLTEEVHRITQYMQSCVSAIKNASDAVVLCNEFTLSPVRQLGIYDTCRQVSQNDIVHALNTRIKQQVCDDQDTFFVALNQSLLRVGAASFYDAKQYTLTKLPYSLKAMYAMAFENYKYLRCLNGISVKCLVLDCDGLLWGGVVGEDEVEGICLGESKQGAQYIEFQKALSSLESRGFILAICSKNNESDVLDVFKYHEHMVLQLSQIATYEINWNNKVENIINIQKKLNISLSSMVFIDDSKFEIEMVRNQLPEVTCLHFPETTSYNNAQRLLELGLFEQLALTAEDKLRTTAYISDMKRAQSKQHYTHIEDYLTDLEMEADLFNVQEKDSQRAYQLITKTNQFNMTCQRHTIKQVLTMIAADDGDIIGLALKDKFDNLGIVALLVMEYKGDSAEINNMIISCRALSRGVEEVLLCHAMRYLQQRGVKHVFAYYAPAKHNQQVRDFYEKNNFQLVSQAQERLCFKIAMADFSGLLPSFYKNVNDALTKEHTACVNPVKHKKTAVS
jgi:FkbH-like protein